MTDEALEDVEPGRLVPGVDDVVRRGVHDLGRACGNASRSSVCPGTRGTSVVVPRCSGLAGSRFPRDPCKRGWDTLLRIAWRPDDADNVVARARIWRNGGSAPSDGPPSCWTCLMPAERAEPAAGLQALDGLLTQVSAQG